VDANGTPRGLGFCLCLFGFNCRQKERKEQKCLNK
jgi:hypothetical protein